MIGGVCYILFAFVPMFLVTSALIIMPEQARELLKDDPQKVLPTLVLEHMPFVMQVLFFGALLSAIKSTASATLLAPSVTFVENIWRQFCPRQSDRQELRRCASRCWCSAPASAPTRSRCRARRSTRWCPAPTRSRWSAPSCRWSAGLYWKRATTQGAVFSIVLGLLAWVLFLVTPAGETFPAQLAGLLAAVVGMLIGSLGPQAMANRHGSHHRLVGLPSS